jgi:hypothetical protein
MSMGWKGILATVLLSATVALGQSAPGIPFNDSAGEGKAMVEDLLTRMPVEQSEILGLLKIRPPRGRTVEVPIRMNTRLGTNSWRDIYETQPVQGRPGEVLVVQHRGLQPNEYFYGQFKERPAEAELKKLAREALFQPFGGSDFFIADLGLEFLHWPVQRIIRKNEMRKGRSCRVVESINPNPRPGAYSRVLSWLDFETGNIILAEGYDANNQKLKEFSVRKISRSEGKAQLKEIEIRNDQTDSRTRLEFNLEIPGE